MPETPSWGNPEGDPRIWSALGNGQNSSKWYETEHIAGPPCVSELAKKRKKGGENNFMKPGVSLFPTGVDSAGQVLGSRRSARNYTTMIPVETNEEQREKDKSVFGNCFKVGAGKNQR